MTDQKLFPIISVIVPVYNTEAYLKRCLDSISLQTLKNFECILIDDGSTDNSGFICDTYSTADSRFLTIHTQNSGVSKARNIGIEKSKGKYICFIDSDDYVKEAFLQDLCCSDADFVGQTFSMYDEDGRFIKDYLIQDKYITTLDPKSTELLKDGVLNYCVAKRYLTEKLLNHGIRFDENLNHSEDTLFAVEYLQFCKTVHIENISNYRYIRYTTRETLNGTVTIERLAMICQANKKICSQFYLAGSKEYEALFYSRIAYSYVLYIANIHCSDKNAYFNDNYSFGISLMNNKDLQKIIQYEPDAIWKLPCSQKFIIAILKRDKALLLATCLRSFVKKQTKKHELL